MGPLEGGCSPKNVRPIRVRSLRAPLAGKASWMICEHHITTISLSQDKIMICTIWLSIWHAHIWQHGLQCILLIHSAPLPLMTFMTFMNHLLPTRSSFQPVPTHWEATPGPAMTAAKAPNSEATAFSPCRRSKRASSRSTCPLPSLEPLLRFRVFQWFKYVPNVPDMWKRGCLLPRYYQNHPEKINNQLTRIAKKMIRTNPTLDTIGRNWNYTLTWTWPSFRTTLVGGCFALMFTNCAASVHGGLQLCLQMDWKPWTSPFL